jgi:hypothetical protein
MAGGGGGSRTAPESATLNPAASLNPPEVGGIHPVYVVYLG